MSPITRRNTLQIYFDVLRAIDFDISANGIAKPTRVQYRSNLSYDKLSRYLFDLEKKCLIVKDPLSLSEKGQNFVKDYEKIDNFITKLGIDYFSNLEEGDD